MESKGIVFTRPNEARVVIQDIPEPGPGMVLVRTVVSTISSGTERANLVGDINVSIHEYFDRAIFPRQCGYSSSGVVEAVGQGVTSLRPGDRVAMSWSVHSQYNCLKEQDVYKLEDGISFEEAALWHIATFPLGAIRKCSLELGEAALVMGQGVLGMMALQQLRLAGAAPIIAADPVPEKRAGALAQGADYALDPFDPGFAGQVRALTGGGVPVALEVTGNDAALDTVLDCMAPRGRVALLGCTRHSEFRIDYYHKVHGPGVVLIGANTDARPRLESSRGLWTTRDDVFAIQKLVSLGRMNYASLVARTCAVEEAPEVYHRLATEKAFPLVQFDWRR